MMLEWLNYFLFLSAIVFAWRRNSWVHAQFQRLNQQWGAALIAHVERGDFSQMNLPWFDAYYRSYEDMFARFWIWDVEKLRKPDVRAPDWWDDLQLGKVPQ